MNFKLALLVPLLISSNLYADDNFCQWNGQTVAIGETIFVDDEILISADSSRDWSGFLLKCTKTIHPISTAKQKLIGDQLGLGKPVMVLAEVHEKFYNHVKGLNLNQMLEKKNPKKLLALDQ